jgi:hypothetical protein
MQSGTNKTPMARSATGTHASMSCARQAVVVTRLFKKFLLRPARVMLKQEAKADVTRAEPQPLEPCSTSQVPMQGAASMPESC